MKRTTGQDRSITSKWRAATHAVRAGTWRSEQGETSEAIFVNSGYTYDNAAEAAARFAGTAPGMTYSRTQNPSVQMLEERIAMMEGAEACRAQASGMAAMTAALLCQLSVGDHLVAARAMFGPCRWVIDNLLPRFGIIATFVDGRDNTAWEAAIRKETKVFFFETPANPTLDVIDIAFVAALGKAHGITTVVDNAFSTSALQRPLELGADVVAYSATKLMDGQGRVLAGAVCGSKDWIDGKLLPFQRNTGPTLAPFNAWIVLKGLETLELRAFKQSENAVKVGKFVEERVPRILHPGLPSHPQHDLAMKQMAAGGAIFSMLLDGGREQAWAVLDALELIDISNNIGDTRSLICHPASTTHSSIGEEARQSMGVVEGMLRMNVGLEDPDDLIEDLDQAFRKAGL
ncbi:aminotransferase class I/II-fold pyridoxal phosphate-dependent enzyme [Novosphingobium sp. G106]|uniref:trans-sulfuration enzyme family protein n=1 Tax=Novosphingobium sp. G106 TaxID=2849500 RepID=UPI001C2CF2D6|nr:aminotransferase class I/II-fold pyridoxal phosphate-dependent enzyme [Novosphingobium sp. G106]MBV1688354.1 aminotransferase class I/II-fold pyridoxal phosphate-dependent enzyme [Novosphingobium sp. G106]